MKFRALMMEAVRTSETSVNFNVTTRRYIPEDSKLQHVHALSPPPPHHHPFNMCMHYHLLLLLIIIRSFYSSAVQQKLRCWKYQ
jgi:hypothetical protein